MCIRHIISVQLYESIEFYVCSPATFNTQQQKIYDTVQKSPLHMKIIMIIAYDEFTLRQTKLIVFDRKKNVKCCIFYVIKVPKNILIGRGFGEINRIFCNLTYIEEKNGTSGIHIDCHRIHHAFHF